MQKSNFKDFFKQAFDADCEKMVQGKAVYVGDKKIGVLSYNHKKQENELKLVEFIIRKKDSILYKVIIGEEVLEVTGDHRFYVKVDGGDAPTYMTVKEIEKVSKVSVCSLQNVKGTFEEIVSIIKIEGKDIILDIQVEGNENYFSNNYLSHNSFYGPNETTPGGNAMKFYASQRIKLNKSQGEKGSDGIQTNTHIKATVVKNKLAPPFKTCEYDIEFGKGISKIAELVELGSKFGFIKKAGSWFSVEMDGETTKLGQGATGAKATLEDNPELAELLEANIYKHLEELGS